MAYRLGRLIGGASGSSGGGGGATGAHFTYREITTTPFTITLAMLAEGLNIFGVNVASAVSILVPNNLPENKAIGVKDESGNAGTNHITIGIS